MSNPLSDAPDLEIKGEYATLDEAIDAAMKADLSLENAVIEEDGKHHSVNDWITCRIAGGHCAAG